jgi:hypothetical protein
MCHSDPFSPCAGFNANSNLYGNATKLAVRREHPFRPCIIVVENASNAQVNLEQTWQRAVYHFPSVSILQEKVTLTE